MAGMHFNPKHWWLILVVMVAVVGLIFFCFYQPDCPVCQLMKNLDG